MLSAQRTNRSLCAHGLNFDYSRDTCDWVVTEVKARSGILAGQPQSGAQCIQALVVHGLRTSGHENAHAERYRPRYYLF